MCVDRERGRGVTGGQGEEGSERRESKGKREKEKG